MTTTSHVSEANSIALFLRSVGISPNKIAELTLVSVNDDGVLLNPDATSHNGTPHFDDFVKFAALEWNKEKPPAHLSAEATARIREGLDALDEYQLTELGLSRSRATAVLSATLAQPQMSLVRKAATAAISLFWSAWEATDQEDTPYDYLAGVDASVDPDDEVQGNTNEDKDEALQVDEADGDVEAGRAAPTPAVPAPCTNCATQPAPRRYFGQWYCVACFDGIQSCDSLTRQSLWKGIAAAGVDGGGGGGGVGTIDVEVQRGDKEEEEEQVEEKEEEEEETVEVERRRRRDEVV
eukprot:CAMPEP_0170749140 /NCGR_PEP_ID=MMETSP0437-20130122/10239_1 /TAXON_ID=0 /ORGANISM="Sexangularia sp." /LENGTH=294 /DNA_ID=CAMNT_0011088049 /DNA_START=22 /DNA_END=906 /DNA_ORIENTATION=+